ncbi:MAG: hypothetical protein ACPGQS_13990, partial [Bradymonadia bacterium]
MNSHPWIAPKSSTQRLGLPPRGYRRVLIVLTLFISVTVNACGTDNSRGKETTALEFITTCEAPAPSADVVLGVGNTDFVTIDSVPDVNIVQGYQGGFHIWGALRFES